jgi:hypothetical protein
MKYIEWTGELAGFVPDLGTVAPGRVLRLATDGQQAAADQHKGSWSALKKDEGEARYSAQQEAETPATADPDAAEPTAAPTTTPDTSAPSPETAAPAPPAPAESASLKGGRK